VESGGFNIVEASIEDHRRALDSGSITSVDLVISYLNRIATYDTCSGLNAFTVFNEKVLEDAAASDARRGQGLPARPLEGIQGSHVKRRLSYREEVARRRSSVYWKD
jgi:Asp-tRNA(Asn)/Glu-tRNA(Gln) amidotransferase A subunit family amidase